MVFPWLIGLLGISLLSPIVGNIFQVLFKFWETLSEEDKKLIIETIVEAFKEILRAFYRWWKSQR